MKTLFNKIVIWWLHKYAHRYGFYRCEWGFSMGRHWLEIGDTIIIENIGETPVTKFVEAAFGGDWMKAHIKE